MSRKILGIDIQHGGISAVMLKSGFSGALIERAEQIPVPAGNGQDAQSALEAVCRKMDAADAALTLSIPPDGVSFRNLRFPFKDAKKIRQILPFELEPGLPFPVEDMIFDFHPVKNQDDARHSDIIAAAAETAGIAPYAAVLTAQTLEPERITISGLPVAVLLTRNAASPDKWIFLDFDAGRCAMFAAADRRIFVMRAFRVGELNADGCKTVSKHMRHTLAGVEAPDDEFEPECIFISGAYPGNGAFLKSLETETGRPVRRLDLIQDMKLSTDGAPAPNLSPQILNNALANAWIEQEGLPVVDFRKGPFAPRTKWAEHKGSFVKTGILLALLLAMALAGVFIDAYDREKKIARLDRQITGVLNATFPEITTIVDPVHQMRTAMDDLKKASVIPEETVKDIKIIDILNDISKLLPESLDIRLTRLVMDEDNVLLSGDTDTFNAVDDMQNRLQGSAHFKKVVISSTNKESKGNRIQFKLRIDL